MKLYIASSWRNEYYPMVVGELRKRGFEVYDFRNPPSGGNGFKWSDISADYMEWSPEEYKQNLNHPLANKQFVNDIEAMKSCDACVLVLPCGRSAHTEAGWFAGAGKKVVVYIPTKQEPELMYKIFDGVATDMDELEAYLNGTKFNEQDFIKDISICGVCVKLLKSHKVRVSSEKLESLVGDSKTKTVYARIYEDADIDRIDCTIKKHWHTLDYSFIRMTNTLGLYSKNIEKKRKRNPSIEDKTILHRFPINKDYGLLDD